MSWAARYIGAPWIADTHDCWGFVRRVQREIFARELPAVLLPAYSVAAQSAAIASHPHRARWPRVETPREGDGVLLSRVVDPHHVGVWVEADGGGVLHCLEGIGVVFQSLAALRLAGWSRIEFHRYTDDTDS